MKRKQERPRGKLYQPETVSWSLLQPERGELWAPLGHRLAPWVPLPEMLKAHERRGPRPGGGRHPWFSLFMEERTRQPIYKTENNHAFCRQTVVFNANKRNTSETTVLRCVVGEAVK